MSGKGSGRRPQQISEDEAAANWARVFGNKAANDPASQNFLEAHNGPDREPDPQGQGPSEGIA